MAEAVLVDYIRVIISVSMLGYASYKDVKTREIHDMVWMIPAAIGLVIDAYEIIVGDLTVTGALFNIGFMVVLSGVLWYLSLFGEADLIAFVALAVIQPRVPRFGFIGYTPLFFSFTIIANTAIAGLLTAIYTFVVNIAGSLRGGDMFTRYSEASALRKLVVMATGRYISMDSLRGPPFEYPMEVRGELVIRPDLFDDEAANKEFRLLREKGADRVWVSATLPYIVVLFVGYLISVVYGDVMFTIMSLLV
jgi:hypothetical protein